MQYCPYCMKPTVLGQLCSDCGKDPGKYTPEAHHFPTGQLLNGRYLVGAALGEGGFGITYLGLDTKLERRVAIKEYFPRALVRRDSSITSEITCYTGSDVHFEKGREQFLREAQVLAKLDDIPQIVHVLDFFSENNSAYIVMEFLEGVTLKERVAQRGFIPHQELFTLIEPVLQALHALHQAGLIHRDISPDNLMIIAKTGKLKLMDFGCAREVGGGHTMTVMLKPGFAPVEQYTGHEQGPWTDLYALCATMYYCLTGKIPPEAMQRMGQDSLIPPSQFGINLPKGRENALIKGLAIQPAQRWRSAEELYGALYSKGLPGILQKLGGGLQPKVPETVQTGKTVLEQSQRKAPSPVAVSTPKETAEKEAKAAVPVGSTEYLSGKAAPPATEYIAKSVDTPDYAEPIPEETGFFTRLKEKFLRLSVGKKVLAVLCPVMVLPLMGVGIFNLCHDHSYGQWSVQKEASCTQQLEMIRVCATCGHKDRKTGDVYHPMEYIPGQESTCTTDGLTDGQKCKLCGTILVPQEVIPAGHTVEIDKAKPATCASGALTEGSHCSVCDFVITEQVETSKALGHNWDGIKCLRCGSEAYFSMYRGDKLLYSTSTILNSGWDDLRNMIGHDNSFKNNQFFFEFGTSDGTRMGSAPKFDVVIVYPDSSSKTFNFPENCTDGKRGTTRFSLYQHGRYFLRAYLKDGTLLDEVVFGVD